MSGSVAEQTHQMCKNAKTVLEAAGSGLEKVVKVNVSYRISVIAKKQGFKPNEDRRREQRKEQEEADENRYIL